jgi:hypothetical protein
VTYIAGSAFGNCKNLTTVSVGDFEKIVQMSFNDNASPFQYATSIISDGVTLTSDIVIPNVPTIGNGVFSRNQTITSVTIPETVTSIGSQAFYGCTALTKVHFSGTPTLENLNRSCFAGSGLTEISIPDSVKIIGDYAFQNCKALTKVNLNQVDKIYEGAFENCTALTEIVIPTSVDIIYRYTFRYCTNLTSVTFERKSYWNASSSPDAYLYGAYVSVTDPSVAATYLVTTYNNRYFRWSSKNW